MGILDGLRKTGQRLGQSLTSILGGKMDAATQDDLEAALLGADLGPALSQELTGVANRASGKPLAEILGAMAAYLAADMDKNQAKDAAAWMEGKADPAPQVVLFCGVNGAGKTTTCGKLASWWASQDQKVMLVAGDTFRAAAVEQLKRWSERAGVEFYSQAEGADPASVAFDAIQKAKAGGFDRVLIDTAGRLQARESLMAELSKVVKVCGKAMDGAPHQSVLVLDGTTGQNMLSQAREFQKVAQATGLVITKLDGSAKAGAVVQVLREFKLPVLRLGVGETLEDLRPFDSSEFAKGMLGLNE